MVAREEEIINAFTSKNNILDKLLSAYHCETGFFGDDVEFYNGGFCVTVPMKKGNDVDFSKCLRIWHRNLSQMKERSDLVAKALRSSKLSYFVDYEYLDQALQVGGIAVPGIRMDWIAESTTLRDFLLNSPTIQQLRKLADNFYHMCADLNKAGFAHGDLSSSNILVNPDMSLKLIDYDSMYVPSMGDRFIQEIAGTDGYQHPQRYGGIKAGSNNDYFSQHVIYVQLLAFAIHPKLCNQISDKELLFSNSELANSRAFRDSANYKLLSSLKDENLQFYLDELEKAIAQPIGQVRSVCDIERPKANNDSSIHKNQSFCPQCGTKYYTSRSRFCYYCGHPRKN